MEERILQSQTFMAPKYRRAQSNRLYPTVPVESVGRPFESGPRERDFTLLIIIRGVQRAYPKIEKGLCQKGAILFFFGLRVL